MVKEKKWYEEGHLLEVVGVFLALLALVGIDKVLSVATGVRTVLFWWGEGIWF